MGSTGKGGSEDYMTLEEIKAAVDEGKTVHWANEGYKVVKGANGEYLVCFTANNHCIGLTWRDGKTLNGKPDEFFIRRQPV